MAGVVDVQNAQTTLHQDLVAENGLIKQLLTAFAAGTLTPAHMSTYAVIAGVLFAWIVTLLFAGKEIADAQRARKASQR